MEDMKRATLMLLNAEGAAEFFRQVVDGRMSFA